MDNDKQEVENIKSGVSKTISDFSDIILERFKNPYIIAFCISWVVCNWKPIVFFIFSKGNVEYKIKVISKHYSDICNYFWWPLGLSLFFLFLIPYLNQANEWFIRKAIRKRADYVKQQIVDKIRRDTHIAQELEKKEKAIKAARESEQHNELVDSLNNTIKSLNDTIHEERIKHNALLNKEMLKNNQDKENEIRRIEDSYMVQIENLKTQIKNFENNYQSLLDDNKVKEFSLNESQTHIAEDRDRIKSLNVQIAELSNIISDLQNEQQILTKEAYNNGKKEVAIINKEKNKLKEQLEKVETALKEKNFELLISKNIGNFIISIVGGDDDIRILKYNHEKEILYFDLLSFEFIEKSTVIEKINGRNPDIITDLLKVTPATEEAKWRINKLL